jgi:hypothetical protein
VKGISSFVASRLDERLAALQSDKENVPSISNIIASGTTGGIPRLFYRCLIPVGFAEVTAPQNLPKSKQVHTEDVTIDLVPKKTKKSDIRKTKGEKSYMPAADSGAGAIIRALARLVRKFDTSQDSNIDNLVFSKDVIITEATSLCTASFLAVRQLPNFVC